MFNDSAERVIDTFYRLSISFLNKSIPKQFIDYAY